MDIKGKVALITGGASGLGLATAEKLLAAGSKIMLVDLNEDNVKKAAESLGEETAYAIANVTEEDSVTKCIKSTVDKFGGIHIVVNCAGIGSASKTVGKDGAHPLQYFKTVIDIAAFDGQIGQAGYSASKAGVVGMTLPIARDLARMGIRVNTIAPGIFDTPMMAMAPDQVRNPLIEMTQFPKRLGLPQEYASLVKHIVENPFLNGETIRLDGGIRMAPK